MGQRLVAVALPLPPALVYQTYQGGNTLCAAWEVTGLGRVVRIAHYDWEAQEAMPVACRR